MISLLIKNIIKIYQFFSSLFPPKCRFYPSCSNYMLQALDKYGLLKGFYLGSIRICKCHPFHSGGYDPID
ncbi:MAG: membrane protein insertion efficiency factor YidD [Candidatus Sericytochromatia bacterium]